MIFHFQVWRKEYMTFSPSQVPDNARIIFLPCPYIKTSKTGFDFFEVEFDTNTQKDKGKEKVEKKSNQSLHPNISTMKTFIFLYSFLCILFPGSGILRWMS